MRERMLFLAAEHHYAKDTEGGIRTGAILEVLLEKYDIDLLAYGNSHKELRRAIKQRCRLHTYRHVFISHSLLVNCIDIVNHLLPEATVITDVHRFESGLSARKAAGKRGLSRPFHKLNAALVRRDERRLLRKTGLLLATSEWDALSFKALSFVDAGKVHVVPHFIDMTEYPYSGPVTQDNRIVLYWNMNTCQGKNAAHLFFAKIYPLIKDQIADIQCNIVSLEVHPEIASLVREDASVVISDRLRPAAAHIREAKAVIVPLLEGCGARMNILESWALRIPVVTSLKGSEGLACEHNRDILLANTTADFAASVVRLLQEPELGALIADRAHQTLLKHYEAGAVKAKILSLV